MSWLENRANSIRGISPQNNTPDVTNSPEWLQSRANTARMLRPKAPEVPINQPIPTTQPQKTGNIIQNFKSTIESFWSDIEKDGIGIAIAKRIIPSKQQPEEVVNQNIQTYTQQPMQQAEMVGRLGQGVASGVVGAVKPIMDFMAFSYQVDKETMNKIADAKGQPTILKELFNKYGQMQAGREQATGQVAEEIKKMEEKIAVKDPNEIDQLASAFGSTLAFMVAGVATGNAYLPALLETYGNMGEVAKRTEGMPLENRTNRVILDGVVNGIYNYFTDKFGIQSNEAFGLKKILQAFVAEASQEGTQQFTENLTSTNAWKEYWTKLVSNKLNDKPLFEDTKPIVEEMTAGVPESAVMGGIVGSMFSVADLGGSDMSGNQNKTTENPAVAVPNVNTEEAPAPQPQTEEIKQPEVPQELDNKGQKAIKNVQKYIQTPEVKLTDSTINFLKNEKIGVDELPFNENGEITLYREGNVVEGKPNSYSLKYTAGQTPYVLTRDEVILNTGSEALKSMYNKTFSPAEVEGMLESLKVFNRLESEVIAIPEVKNVVNVSPQEEIKTQENRIKEIYATKEEEVNQATYEVLAEMDIAEAGQRVFLENGEVMGVSSTFPDWVPSELRSKKLFNEVLSNIVDMQSVKYPPSTRSKQRALYDALLEEIDRRTNLDTSKERSAILQAYEKESKQNVKTKKTIRRSTKGSEGTNATVAKEKGSVERSPESIAKTPAELKQIVDNLNKYGQKYAILRKTGGINVRVGGMTAVGLFVQPSNSKRAKSVAKEGEVRLKGKYIAEVAQYISTLAHELGHATEFHLTGATNKNTWDVFGKELSSEQKSTIQSELKEVTKALEGERALLKNANYYNKPTELLARFFEMYITNPELLADIAPNALEAIELQSVKHPMIREFMEIIDENASRVDTPGKTFLPDLRQTYQKALGSKVVGNIAYDAEITHRAMVERAKKVLPDFIASKFKNVKDSPELLFRVAESIKVTKSDVPEFGTRDYVTLESKYRDTARADKIQEAGYTYVSTEVRDDTEIDTYAKTRYTPEEAQAMYSKLSEEGKQLIKDFTAQRSEAKDYFNREVIKDVNKINSNLEGWVHHYFEEGKGTTVGKSRKFRTKRAGATMRRTGTEGYVEDLQKAVTKAVVELESAKSFNNFIDKQFARVSKPIPEGQKPDAGWVEVMGNLKKGIGLEGDSRTVVITGEKAVKVKSTRYQVPQAIYERYKLYRGLTEEASTATKMLQRLNSYWAINVLTDVGTAGTNFVGGAIQYSAKVLTDFYTETLTGDIRYPQTKRDITSLLKVLLPKGWMSAPDWIYGSDLSNWYGQFSQKKISKTEKALDSFADKNLKLFGSIERYFKKVIMLSENVGDLKSLESVGLEGLSIPTKEEQDMIARLNKEVDLYAYDYDNVPLWLLNMKKNPISAGIKPFATYPYKYAKQITGMIESAFDQSIPWQDRTAKILALSTIVALYSAYSLDRKKKQQTPEGTNKEIEIRAKSAGNLYTGLTDEYGNELFVRVSKYPFIGITEAGIQLMRGNTDSASNIFKEMLGSIGFVGQMALNAFGYRDEYNKYDAPEVVVGNNLSSLVPYARILDEISRGMDPYKRKQTTFSQTFTRLIPTTSPDLQEKLHGEKRTIKIPIEGDVKRTPGTAYTRTTIDKTLENYWQDILLGSLTGIYIKRVNPKEVEAQIIRDEKNKAKAEKEKK